MEMRGMDFSKKNTKDVLVITLGTEEESFDLRLMVPTKGIYEAMTHAAGLIDDVLSGEHDPSEFMDELYSLICRAMSYNTDAKIITPEFLEQVEFDFADAGAFIGDYTQFVLFLATGKNSNCPSTPISMTEETGMTDTTSGPALKRWWRTIFG